MPTIFQREDTKGWEARIRLKGFPAIQKNFGTKADAVRWATDTEAQMRRGTWTSTTAAETTLLSDLIKSYRTDYAPFHYKEGSKSWSCQCDRLTEGLGRYSLSNLNHIAIAEYRDGRLKGRGGRAAVGDASVRKELFLLSKILGWAESDLDIALPRGNPVKRVRKPKDSKARDRRLSPVEMERLLAECKASRNDWVYLAALVSIETGMRQGELLALTWRDRGRDGKTVLIRDSKNGEARSVPLSPAAQKVLEGMPKSLDGRMFPVQRLTLAAAFKGACKRAGIDDFHWHDLRHEALTRLAERGDFSLLDIASVSGHKTLAMLKRYTHLQAENLADRLAKTG